MAVQTPRRSNDASFAIPINATKAKDSVLQQNAGSLVLQVKGCVALDLDPAYVADDGGDPGVSLSTTVTRALRAPGAGSWGHYVNPLSGSTAILCQSALPTSAGELRPAVWITDDERLAYAAFSASATTRNLLPGTLLVVFTTRGGRASAIDIFYVDDSGQRSTSAAALAL